METKITAPVNYPEALTEAVGLFSNPRVPPTEGVKYAGSKVKLLPFILHLANKSGAKTILDGFSGTTRVSQAFAKTGYRVISNDIAPWSQTFATCYLLNTKKPKEYEPLIQHLNSLKPVDGWFTKHYGGLPNDGSAVHTDGLKKPWQIHNTRKLDAIRMEIDRLSLSPVDKAVALTSLIALDSVDSTLGHYASYLRDWSPRSYGDLALKIPAVFVNDEKHQVSCRDIFSLLPETKVDLAYFDPPYGSNNEKMPPSRVRYASYYHLWATICRNDEPPLFGKAKRRKDSSDIVVNSEFEEFRKNKAGRFIALASIEKLLRTVQARHIILSYSSGGRATAEQLNDLISSVGNLIEILEIDHQKNVMAAMRWTNQWSADAKIPNKEFLFLIEKS